MILEKPIPVKHKKTGNYYRIIGFSKNCTNENDGQILVLYEALTIERDAHFSREFTEFLEKFECPDITETLNIFINIIKDFKKPTNKI